MFLVNSLAKQQHVAIYVASQSDAAVGYYSLLRLLHKATSCPGSASSVSSALCPYKYFYPLLLNYRKWTAMTFHIIWQEPLD